MAEGNLLAIQASEYSACELNEKLAALHQEAQIRLQVDETLDGLCAGLSCEASIIVEGNVGDFAFLLSDRGDFDVSGNAGICCGHSMVSGSVLIHGSAGDCLGAYASGGFIAVHSKAQNRCAMALDGADVFVRSTVGDEAGYAMREGALVLGNGAGENVGLNMAGGIIYIRGEVKSVAPTARQTRMKDADALRLSLLLARAGIKGNGGDFKVFRAKSQGK